MEDLDQAYGYILYRTQIANGASGELVINGLHDYAQVYVDQKLIGTLDRRLGQSHLTLPPMLNSSTLDILVENSGRVNFTKVIRTERKGIIGSVHVGGREAGPWQIYALPMVDLSRLHFIKGTCEGPCFYRYSMDIESSTMAKAGASLNSPQQHLPDTFLDTHGLAKGAIFLNGQVLGRFWSVGPEFTLYTPGPWLHSGSNEVVVFDLLGSDKESLKTTNRVDYGGDHN